MARSVISYQLFLIVAAIAKFFYTLVLRFLRVIGSSHAGTALRSITGLLPIWDFYYKMKAAPDHPHVE
ncbi:hypothetical protein PL8927_900052 [Planktothrix serta PCC 8927]|uniref:Uncharacterized protein n=1 Tax=Planktothrix serta PCC 8927 TaxID=671068 RepID=A0A7Z9E424_9CYAN|nr:hypothetical protein [Planktothrix serta]VXD25682.1 hypothetical protein PL8927_900052 [Planktothrix serta PCC 8927]